MKKVLTIAGSDCSGGAGIQADLKTMISMGIYGMSAITALTAQNTIGVRGVQESTPEFLESQLDCIFQDIVPDAVKIGMVSSSALIEVIAERLTYYHADHIVLDPVMVSTSKSSLLNESALDALIGKLIPLAEIITPNIPEAEILSRMKISTKADMKKAAHMLSETYGIAVLVKGGHLDHVADDVLCDHGKCIWFLGERIDNPNTHGTGCTLSSAIACGLAFEMTVEESIGNAKRYLTKALLDGMNLGYGSGPLNHGHSIKKGFWML